MDTWDTTKPQVTLFKGDCLEIMPTLKRKVDLVLTDPPYGTTECKWDTVIPFDKMWEAIRGIRKEKAAVVLFGNQPFSASLLVSNVNEYRHQWFWDKRNCSNPTLAKHQPLKHIEDILVFGRLPVNYYPQGLVISNRKKTRAKGKTYSAKADIKDRGAEYVQQFTNYPKVVIPFSLDRDGFHPTQKPVALLEYLIKTYTQPGETVLDFTMGSGSTGVAAVNTGRDFIGIEQDEKYFEIAERRINEALEAIQ